MQADFNLSEINTLWSYSDSYIHNVKLIEFYDLLSI